MNLRSFLFKDDENPNPKIKDEKINTDKEPLKLQVVPHEPTFINQTLDVSVGETLQPYIDNSNLDKKMYDTIHAEVFGMSSPFSKFVDMYNKMKKIIPNERQLLAAVMEALETNVETLINSINTTHQNILMDVNSKFEQEVNSFISENIETNENVLAKISDEISEIDNKMKELSTKQMEISQIIYEDRLKINKKKNDFSNALNFEKANMKKWLDLINSYVSIINKG